MWGDRKGRSLVVRAFARELRMTENSADQIQQRMRQLRNDLADEVAHFASSARTMTDWRYYVKAYPWVCLGVAAAAGYLIVPRRIEMVSPDAETLLQLAERNKLVVKSDPKPDVRGGLAGPVFNFIANAAVRGVIAYLGQKAGKAGGKSASQSTRRANLYNA